MKNTVSSKVFQTLKNVVDGDLANFEITVHDPNKKGEGYLSEMLFISIKGKGLEQRFDLIIKQATANKSIRDMYSIHSIFINEIYFYTNVWPQLNEFQQSIPSRYQFQKLPKCFAANIEENSEQLVLENLKLQSFEVYDKRVPLDKEHFAVILKEYGKFHALSFAYKELSPDVYAKLVSGHTHSFLDIAGSDFFQKGNISSHKSALESLQLGVDDAVIEKYKYYPEICQKLFLDSLDKKTKYTAIIHGDCWSNNMMFKYNEAKEIADVRFLDFQMTAEGSPCCDLSYCIYSGASKEVLQNLDYYLKIYHNSLSETLTQFGCDSEKLYPFRELKNDWKRHCQLGFAMALMVWKMKLMHGSDNIDLEDMMNEDVFQTYGYDEVTYRRITRDLILHLYENDYL